MKRILLLIVLFLIHFSTQAQSKQANWEKEIVLKDQYRVLSIKYASNFIITKDSVGILKVEIVGLEKISCEFYFDSAGICESSVFVYYCDDCSKKHIDEHLKNGNYKWMKEHPFVYYSKRNGYTQMEIFNSNPAVTVVTLTRKDWTKKEYRALTKNLERIKKIKHE